LDSLISNRQQEKGESPEKRLNDDETSLTFTRNDVRLENNKFVESGARYSALNALQLINCNNLISVYGRRRRRQRHASL